MNIAANLGANAICTPALLPRVFSDEYYGFIVQIGDQMVGYANRMGLDTLLTVVARWSDAATATAALERADDKWGEVERQRILFTDRFNTGEHVRLWLNALREGADR